MFGTKRPSTEFYITAAVILLAIVAQGTLLSRVRLLGVGPNLLLVMAVCWSLLRSVPDGLLWAFGGGLGVDLIAGLPLGGSALALMPPCFLAGLGRYRIFANSLVLPALLVMLATPIHGWVMLFTQQLLGHGVDWLNGTLRIILPELALNTLLTLAVYPVLRWLALSLGATVPEA